MQPLLVPMRDIMHARLDLKPARAGCLSDAGRCGWSPGARRKTASCRRLRWLGPPLEVGRCTWRPRNPRGPGRRNKFTIREMTLTTKHFSTRKVCTAARIGAKEGSASCCTVHALSRAVAGKFFSVWAGILLAQGVC